MKFNSSYLVCKEHTQEVRKFLSQFFQEEKTPFSYESWITFIIPDTDFRVNLMDGNDQEITQNMTFEITCDTLEQLQELSKKYNTKVESFLATETNNSYRYYYIEILGPKNICKIEINFIEKNVNP